MSYVYTSKGYKNRKDYLESLAEEFDIDFATVVMVANTLGRNEDFDGLISALEDYDDIRDD